MQESERFGIDQGTFEELKKVGQGVEEEVRAYSNVERNFGDTSDQEFKDATIVVPPNNETVRPGETPEEAHIRLQQDRQGSA